MEAAYAKRREQNVEEENPTGWRRPVCDEYGAIVAWNQRGHRQCDSDQAESDRYGDGNDRRDRAGAQSGIPLDYFASLRRDGGYVHRGSSGGNSGGTNQNRLGFAHGPHREVQPASAHRRRTRYQRKI